MTEPRRGVGALAEPESTPPPLTSPPKAVDPVQVLSGDKAAPPEPADIRAEPDKPSQGDAPTVESKPDAEQAKESAAPKDPFDRLRVTFERLAQCTLGPDGLQVSDTDCVRAFEDALRQAQQEGRKNVGLMRSVEAPLLEGPEDEHLPLQFYAIRGLASHDRLSTNTRRMLERLMDGDDPVLAEAAAKARLSPIRKLSAGVALVQGVLKEHRHRRVQLAACQFLNRPEMKSSTTFARQLFRLAENNNTPPVVRSCAARVVSRVMRATDQARLRKLLEDPVTAQPALMGLQKATWTDKPWDIALAWYSDNAEKPDKLHWSVMYTMLPPDGQHDGYPRLEGNRVSSARSSPSRVTCAEPGK